MDLSLVQLLECQDSSGAEIMDTVESDDGVARWFFKVENESDLV